MIWQEGDSVRIHRPGRPPRGGVVNAPGKVIGFYQIMFPQNYKDPNPEPEIEEIWGGYLTINKPCSP